MQVRDLAAGVICTGFEGANLTSEVAAQLKQAPFAGIILFGRNTQTVEQTRALTDSVRRAFGERVPIIAIDQEGGRVVRLREGIAHIPSMMTLAATRRPKIARMAGEQTAHDLRRIGANVDFAPVLDLALHRDNTVIGTRSFGDDPQTVIKFGSAFARGLEAGGVVATYKHFPGHGSTAVDTHLQLPRVSEDQAVLRSRDLLPFVTLLPNARAVMTAHIIVEAFDKEHPATASRHVLTDVLRNEIGFTGVCFTDCMEMDAIAKSVGTAQGAVLALQAGADCILISHRIDLAMEAIEGITAAVSDGRLPLLRLQEAYERVSKLRHTLQPPIDAAAPPLYANIAEEIANAAVTSVRGNPHVDPRNLHVISFLGTTTEGAQGTHAHHAPLRAAGGAVQLFYPLDPTAEELRKLMDELSNSEADVAVLSRRAHVHQMQAAAIHEILRHSADALLISMREPFDILEFPEARNVVAMYGDDDSNMLALSALLFERKGPSGELPVRWPAVR
ncbi:MAG: beta-N-acetylhexosaminidase [Candidatus Eremiobacteraeota bacterium]|nr:beta-N-acetylhexosaminidase [Candidatus Eremiobacteraeota bacterium]